MVLPTWDLLPEDPRDEVILGDDHVLAVPVQLQPGLHRN